MSEGMKKLFNIVRNSGCVAARNAAIDSIEKQIENIEKANSDLVKKLIRIEGKHNDL